MSPLFKGFRSHDARYVKVHEEFFSALLPLVDDLNTLKVILFTLWALWQREGHYRWLSREDYAGSPELMDGLVVSKPHDTGAALDAALANAVRLRALLLGEAPATGAQAYFLNSERGREAHGALQAGTWLPDAPPQETLPAPPTIFELVERSVMPLTPRLRDLIAAAVDDYGEGAVRRALDETIKQGKHVWSYTETILKRWKMEHRLDAPDTGHDEQHPDARGRLAGRLSDLLK